MANVPFKFIHRRSFQDGVNDSDFQAEIGADQVNRAINMDMSHDGRLESRGGSIRTTSAATAASETVHLIYEYKRVVAGAVTRTFMVFAGTRLLSSDLTAGTFTEVATGLADVKPSCATFKDDAGLDVMYWADGTNFKFYDGIAVTNMLTHFQAGAAGATVPRYLLAQHQRLWAAGGTCQAHRVFHSPQAHAEQTWGANDYVTIEGARDQVTGLGTVYDYPFIGAEDSCFIVAGKAGDAADPFRVVRVASNAGTTSHWSIVSHEGNVFFVREKQILIGRLRAAEKDGLDVEVISGNVRNTYGLVADGEWDTVQGVYLAEAQQIYWTMQTTDASNPDRVLVYSTARSRPNDPIAPDAPDTRFVWAGYWTGLDFNSIGVVRDSNGAAGLYVGGSDGYVRKMYSGYLDDRAFADTGGDYVLYEVRPRAEDFGGPATAARVHSVYPRFFMRKNSSLQAEWILNNSQRLPSTPSVVQFRGNVPYMYGDAEEDVTTSIDTTIITNKPVLTARIRVGAKANTLQLVLTNVDAIDGELYSFSGVSYKVQPKGIPAR